MVESVISNGGAPPTITRTLVGMVVACPAWGQITVADWLRINDIR
jgi:hypothetical protein